MQTNDLSCSLYSFGMQMRGERGVTHGYDAVDYRYAFQGMEQDNEVSDNGNSYTTEFRQYDPRLGRWKSLDPLMSQFPSMSPYVAFDNNPIFYTDPHGLSSEGGGDKVRSYKNADKSASEFNKTVGGTIEKHSDGSRTVHYCSDGNDVSQYFKQQTSNSSSFSEFNNSANVAFGNAALESANGLKNTIENPSLVLIGLYEFASNVNGRISYLVGTPNPQDAFLGTNYTVQAKDVMLAQGEEYTGLKDSPSNAGEFVGKVAYTTLEMGTGPILTEIKAVEVVSKVNKVSKVGFKSFTKSNYRHNLKVLTGKSGDGFDAHHIYPQAERFHKHWDRVGLNIHDPHNMSWWSLNAHRRAAKAYNKAWDNFFKVNPNATKDQILSFGEMLMKKYGDK